MFLASQSAAVAAARRDEAGAGAPGAAEAALDGGGGRLGWARACMQALRELYPTNGFSVAPTAFLK